MSRSTTPAKKEQGGELAAMYEQFVDEQDQFTQEELVIPRLQLLQKLSPQVDPDNASYVEGAKAGHILNTATNEIYSEVTFLPVVKEHVFVEFVPRDSGGGFVGVHDPNSDMVKRVLTDQNRFEGLKTPNGNDLMEMYQIYAVGVDENWEPVNQFIVPFKSTQIKAYRSWASRVQNLTIPGTRKLFPLYAHVWRLTSVQQKNSQGSFYNWKINLWAHKPEDSRLTPEHTAFQAAADFRTLLSQGNAKADYEGAAKQSAETDEAPF